SLRGGSCALASRVPETSAAAPRAAAITYARTFFMATSFARSELRWLPATTDYRSRIARRKTSARQSTTTRARPERAHHVQTGTHRGTPHLRAHGMGRKGREHGPAHARGAEIGGAQRVAEEGIVVPAIGLLPALGRDQ